MVSKRNKATYVKPNDDQQKRLIIRSAGKGNSMPTFERFGRIATPPNVRQLYNLFYKIKFYKSIFYILTLLYSFDYNRYP